MSKSRPPLPPFSFESAVQKVRQAEDAWNTRDPERVALAYTEDSRWRNRAEFLQAIVEFLKRKWAKELDYHLIKELWAFHENRSVAGSPRSVQQSHPRLPLPARSDHASPPGTASPPPYAPQSIYCWVGLMAA